MNIILNTPLPLSAVSKKDYDNRILYVFLVFMLVLMALGFMFVDLTKSEKVTSSVEKPLYSEQSEYV